jgi:hypothetical protein
MPGVLDPRTDACGREEVEGQSEFRFVADFAIEEARSRIIEGDDHF